MRGFLIRYTARSAVDEVVQLAENAHPFGGQPGKMQNRFLLSTFSANHISLFTSERRRRQATTV